MPPFRKYCSLAGFWRTIQPATARPSIQDMDLPGLYLHQLRGKHRGRWSVRVSENWRITFKFDGSDAIEIDYEDYH